MFELDIDFIKDYVNKEPKWGPVGYVTYKRTYARPLHSISDRHCSLATTFNLKGKTEEWWLTCVRVVEGTYSIQKRHCMSLGLPWNEDKAQSSAQEMYEKIFNFKFLPPGRGLWMMGTDYILENGGAPLNNCSFSSTKDIDENFAEPFCFLMDMSMLGVGVGGDTRGTGKVVIREPEMSYNTHFVDDSRNGWVVLIRRILNAYVGKDSIPLQIDYSRIRKAGEPIKGFGGTASGPKPLVHLVESIQELLNKNVNKRIESSVIVDLFNLIGKCVVSGNVRRSAEIMFGEPHDEAFLSLKDPEINLESLMSHRWASNNSIWAYVGMNYEDVSKLTGKNGEPGYMWLDNAQAFGRMKDPVDYKDAGALGGNPCLEQTLFDKELCTLVETFPSLHDNLNEYIRTLKFAYLYAKTVTILSTHNAKTNAVMLKNRRIGTSMSGITQAMTKLGRREFFRWCDEGYEYIDNLDKIYSDWLCVPVSIKKTSVKPSGTVSLLPGVTPGIHYPYSKYYWRVIRFANNSPMLPKLRNAGYPCYETNEPNTTAVYFPVMEEHFDRSRNNVSMWEQLENAAQMQYYWADNQVSVTVTFTNGERCDIKNALELYETRLKGVSFLPLENHGYEHAPLQSMTKEEYEEISNKINEVLSFDDADNEVIEKFCDSEACEI